MGACTLALMANFKVLDQFFPTYWPMGKVSHLSVFGRAHFSTFYI